MSILARLSKSSMSTSSTMISRHTVAALFPASSMTLYGTFHSSDAPP
eukprot:CAMPEP_0201621324 /NCGR_PEP_ID=MMETSP0492-20130828/46592_1 /ASSEMBLY_ACC=CAM_ASM_000837 /TAXON_ID=420259 /ORGANISM="Thalassiosira gravida, Strain GMp14c1" /LENGTH=46 /DNA_ID= /DNA_START= /DNA_END= /DNA_ORIENTATION=